MLKLRLNVGIFLFAVCMTAANAETITFDTMPVNQLPDGFTSALTGSGKPSVWHVKPAPNGEIGKVITQMTAETIDNRFPLLIRNGVSATNVDVSVRFQPISGKIDQAAGLVWRYKDSNNYYIVRANALEDNVVAYKVENGRRTDLPVKGKGLTYGAPAKITKRSWNTLAVSMRGSIFSVSLNGKSLYEVEDSTFTAAGQIGLWTKADSVMMFDDFTWNIVK